MPETPELSDVPEPSGPTRPNVVLVLADDMGFSDIAAYGGEVRTPSLDRLAAGGVRMTQFYNTARCSPSRASLLTGLHPHQVGIGILNFDDAPDGYPGDLADDCATVAEVLRDAGYATYLSGKWHLSVDMETPNHSWPTRRGFDRFFGTLEGAGSFYRPRTLTRDETNVEHEAEEPGWFYTDAISEHAVRFLAEHDEQRPEDPFFLYLAYTAPHWPLHAHDDDIARYEGRFDAGWDQLREERLERLVSEGIIDRSWVLSPRDERVPAWEDAPDHAWEAQRMATYAAQVDRMDQGIGLVLAELERTGRLEDTLVVFLSDNGGCAEEMPPGPGAREFVTSFVPVQETTREGDPVTVGNDPALRPGPESTYMSYGRAWANLSNTPFREYKHWVHEGGIATPFIAHWPRGLRDSSLCRIPAQLVDVLPTIAEVAGATYPSDAPPAEGRSLLGAWRGEQVEERDLFWEHEGNSAVRRGRWKLVRKHRGDWELYDIDADRTELHDLAADEPDLVATLADAYEQWAQRCGVLPREQVLALYAARGHGLPEE